MTAVRLAGRSVSLLGTPGRSVSWLRLLTFSWIVVGVRCWGEGVTEFHCEREECEYTEWSGWGGCSATQCGEKGTEALSRQVITLPSCGGSACTGPREDLRPCVGDSPLDCVYKEWSDWTECSQSKCDVAGIKTRRKDLKFPGGCGGAGCSEVADETAPCTGDTMVDCVHSAWSEWSNCSESKCDVKGVQQRLRTITQDSECGGAACTGSADESRDCMGESTRDCEISLWTEWTLCDVDGCGSVGSQSRDRMVSAEASCGGEPCPQILHQDRDCEQEGCDECASRPCQNKGRCVDILGGFKCECKKGYVGVHCEDDRRKCKTCKKSPCRSRSSQTYCHVTDPHVYVQCSGTQCLHMPCPPGTTWNTKEKRCDTEG